MNTNILTIKNLSAKIYNKYILNNLNLDIKSHSIHIIMGPNGAGKSTLSRVLLGDPLIKIIAGSINFYQKNLFNLPIEIRSLLGLFILFQQPVEIKNIQNYNFLKEIYLNKEKYLKKKLDLNYLFLKLNKIIKKLNFEKSLLNRSLNYNFSGGEKKKNEILQLLLLNPKLIFFDELDSGLDISSLTSILELLQHNFYKCDTSYIFVTHSFNLFDIIQPDFIHILINGSIVKTGDISILKDIKHYGYNIFI